MSSSDSFSDIDCISINSFYSFSDKESDDSSFESINNDNNDNNDIINNELTFDDLENEIYVKLLYYNYENNYKNIINDEIKIINFFNDKAFNNILKFIFNKRKEKLTKEYCELMIKNI